MKRFLSALTALILISSILYIFPAAESTHTVSDKDIFPVIFTNGLNSRIDSFYDGNEPVGGFAKIKTFIDRTNEQYKDSLVLDAGCFSMGTLYQTLFNEHAPELKLFGSIGYDAVGIGTNEFDYGAPAFLNMLDSASSSSHLPEIILSNISLRQNSELPDSSVYRNSVREYSFIKKGGFTAAVFTLTDNVNSGCLITEDPVKCAKRLVSEILNVGSPDIIICLASLSSDTPDSLEHSLDLASEVPGIDVIIDASYAKELAEPVFKNNTAIISAGSSGKFIGKFFLKRENGKCKFSDYTLSELNDSVPDDPQILQQIDTFRPFINKYLSDYGFESKDSIICRNQYDFESPTDFHFNKCESPLGNIIADSFLYEADKIIGCYPSVKTVSILPHAAVFGTVGKENLTVSDIYSICSKGTGSDGTPGYPLCSFYVTGHELYNLAEADATLSKKSPSFRLSFSGIDCSANTCRLPYNKVFECLLSDKSKINDDSLYRVVTSWYFLQNLNKINKKAFGFLKVEPKNENGEIISDYSQCILKSSSGAEIKQWFAVADYFSSFDKNSSGIPLIPPKYSVILGRKNINEKFSLQEIFIRWNLFSWLMFALVIFIIAIIVFVTIIILKVKKKKKRQALLRTCNLE